MRERNERGWKWKHQGSPEEAFPLRCLPLSRCYGSFRRLLARSSWPHFPSAGPAGRDPRSKLQQATVCDWYNTGYLRPPHTVLTGACRYSTRPEGRVAPPAPLDLYCRGQLARRDTSTRSTRHSILIPGPVWIYYRLGTLGMCGRAIMLAAGPLSAAVIRHGAVPDKDQCLGISPSTRVQPFCASSVAASGRRFARLSRPLPSR